ncbi:hypothetical protein [Microbacterium sp. NPDC096154]|uniref:hypothetical protein n=1 Tax=Microbacterium sp. NPDC096154 TaxID=3155549 RepID=UPI003323459C
MLRALHHTEPPAPLAYRVPWHVGRDDAAHPLLVNAGAESAEYVRVHIADGPLFVEAEPWGHMRAGESRELCLCACDLDDTTITVTWFRPGDDREWAWAFVV